MQATSRHRPAFGIDVPEEFYWWVADNCGGSFADSYLFGGEVQGGKFMPRTLTGWERLKDNFTFMGILKKEGMTMVKPRPYDGPPAWEILGLADPGASKGKKRGGWE